MCGMNREKIPWTRSTIKIDYENRSVDHYSRVIYTQFPIPTNTEMHTT
jgi:hypothetical protein